MPDVRKDMSDRIDIILSEPQRSTMSSPFSKARLEKVAIDSAFCSVGATAAVFLSRNFQLFGGIAQSFGPEVGTFVLAFMAQFIFSVIMEFVRGG